MINLKRLTDWAAPNPSKMSSISARMVLILNENRSKKGSKASK